MEVMAFVTSVLIGVKSFGRIIASCILYCASISVIIKLSSFIFMNKLAILIRIEIFSFKFSIIIILKV